MLGFYDLINKSIKCVCSFYQRQLKNILREISVLPRKIWQVAQNSKSYNNQF